jgi:hypothetical protein
METTEAKNLVGLAADDEQFVKQTRELFRKLRRSVYQKVCAICEIDEAAEVLCEDDKMTLRELRQKWAGWYAEDLQPEKPKMLTEHQAEVADGLVEKLEMFLEEYDFACQEEVLKKPVDRLPKRAAKEELEQLRDDSILAFVDAVLASGLCVEAQIVLCRRLRANFEKLIRGLNDAKKQDAC